jgi:hypothetical protein
MLTFVEGAPEEIPENFCFDIDEMLVAEGILNDDGELTLTEDGIEAFTKRLWDYLRSKSPEIDLNKLTHALISTKGKYASMQDQAEAIKNLL